MEKPFAADCTGELRSIGSPEGVEVITGHSFTYNGLTLSFLGGELTADQMGVIRQLELRQSMSRADLGTGSCSQHNNQYYGYYQCLLANSEVYIIVINGEICLDAKMFVIKDRPWPGEDQLCREKLKPLYTALKARCPLS